MQQVCVCVCVPAGSCELDKVVGSNWMFKLPDMFEPYPHSSFHPHQSTRDQKSLRCIVHGMCDRAFIHSICGSARARAAF